MSSISKMRNLIFQFTGNQYQGFATSHPSLKDHHSNPPLNKLLQNNHAFIAGSASTLPFVNDASIVPGDLDIWVPINPDDKCTWIKNPDYVVDSIRNMLTRTS